MYNLDSIEDVKNFWTENIKFAPALPQNNTHKECSNPRIVELPFTYEAFLKHSPKVVLECGSSHIDRDYFKAYWELILNKAESANGIDITELRPGRYGDSISDSEISKFNTKVADIRDTSFNSNTFDMIFCISTLEHVGFEVGRVPTPDAPNAIVRLNNFPDNPAEMREDFKGLQELKRITKKNGHIILTLPFVSNCRYLQQTDSMGFVATEIGYDESRVKAIVSDSKLNIEKYQVYYENDEGWQLASDWSLPSGSKQAVVCLSLEKQHE